MNKTTLLVRATALFLLSTLVFAIDRNISWTPPTQNTDGSVLLEQDLDFYTFYCDGLAYQSFDSIIGTNTAVISLDGLTEGTHICDLRVTALNGAESGPSNSVNFTIGPRGSEPSDGSNDSPPVRKRGSGCSAF